MPPRSQPRVFVSSVIEGFAAHRQAAREAIAQLGGEAILVNEDFGSQNASSRNACLDAVASADIFVLVIGTRGGVGRAA
jgi:ABC-type branched-subunit amino acid transport system substrate-binding protein